MSNARWAFVALQTAVIRAPGCGHLERKVLDASSRPVDDDLSAC
jgi:hypothetical protein